MGLFISTTSPTSDYRDSPLDKAITVMAVKLARKRSQGELPIGPALEVNFLISGKLEKPSFAGMRMGNYSDTQNTLFFERAVPEGMLNSFNANEFVQAVLQDVVSNAAEYFSELKIDFDLVSWKRTLKAIS